MIGLVAFSACRTEVKFVPEHMNSEAGESAEDLVGEVAEVSTPVPILCEHEDPPSSFTGGLVYYREIGPDGGDLAVQYKGRGSERSTGTIDWENI